MTKTHDGLVVAAMAPGKPSRISSKVIQPEIPSNKQQTNKQTEVAKATSYFGGSFATAIENIADSNKDDSCIPLVKELNRENTILIQKNPKSKIKLMVIDKYKQMINANKVNKFTNQNTQQKSGRYL